MFYSTIDTYRHVSLECGGVQMPGKPGRNLSMAEVWRL